MAKRDPVNYDDIRETVRNFCAEKLYELEKSLRPLVDGTFGEVLPGHLAAYLAAVRQLAKLYQAEKPPTDLENLIPAAKVTEILAGMKEQHERDLERVAAETEARVRRELSTGAQLSISAARSVVTARLDEMGQRVQGGP